MSAAWEEVEGSRAEIERLTGKPCRHFAFPNGDYTAREILYVKRAGFLSARTVDIGWNDAASDPYTLKTIGVLDDVSTDRLLASFAGISLLYQWGATRRFSGKHRTITVAPSG